MLLYQWLMTTDKKLLLKNVIECAFFKRRKENRSRQKVSEWNIFVLSKCTF